MKEEAENLLLLGKVLRPHGLGGLLRIDSYAESGDSFLASRTVFFQDRSGEWWEEKVVSVHPHKGAFLMKLKGLSSIEEAERMRGASIYVEKSGLDQKDQDEFFWHEIIGLEVYLKTGSYIGEIENILSTGSNDIYVVRNGDSEILVPAVHGVVEDIDLPSGKMIISDVEGLLDLNEA
ncbi:MAG: 16S rRNA processing protein RimM [Deltaproteobacteria bacterium HGW-Deltaproteobacteria-21]|nr:MAG: 16S rRNA processing protein RimM [Deltaproteobacteria bacterium HGW-Deltaproteobacteria-21]